MENVPIAVHGVRHRDIQPAELQDGLLDQLVHRAAIADVTRQEQRARPAACTASATLSASSRCE